MTPERFHRLIDTPADDLHILHIPGRYNDDWVIKAGDRVVTQDRSLYTLLDWMQSYRRLQECG